VLLADFNDIDKYQVDPESVFVNVKNFKSIENQIDFLSDEQLEVLKRFFNSFDAEKPTKIKDEFLKIWEIMHPLYKNLKKELALKNIGFEGMVFKDALERIGEFNKNDFGFHQVYFIGFNAITPIEEEVFLTLKNLGLAYFFWDYDSYYIENKAMEAGLFQRKFIKKFPPIEIKKECNQLKGKSLNVISAPTNHGQVFNLSQILSKINSKTPADTAIVLSDEQLLMSVINYIPNIYPDINITMGYPLSDSLSGSFIDLIIQLQQNVRKSKNESFTFYYKPVSAIMRHPFVQYFFPDQANVIVDVITKENLYNVEQQELNGNEWFSELFVGVESVDQFVNYIEQLLGLLQVKLLEIEKPSTHFLLEVEFLFRLLVEVRKLNANIYSYGIKLQLPTYFGLLRKVIQSVRVPFEGEPVSGLQVMGFLETRNLDFKNVIILSVNEGVIPVQSRSASFIPFGLRRGFGLPTSELNDAMYAYYFYRIMQSAENVWLLYNSGSSGMSTGEKSRLLYQLEFDENFNVESHADMQSIEVVSNRTITIEKNGEVWERMADFFHPENPKMLSPSALSIYLQCPLRFYFRSVAKVREADEVEEVVDARLFGNIFHKAAESLYQKAFDQKELITDEVITQILNNEEFIDGIINRSFSEVFFGDSTKRKLSIEGKNQVVFNVIKKYLIQMLQKDKAFVPFSIVGLEKNIASKFKVILPKGDIIVNLGGQIDRLDRSEKGLRVIDYKTGGDKLTFEDLDDVFDAEKIKDNKAIFQTFLYSYLVSGKFPDENAILPMVYQVKKMFESQVTFAINSKKYAPFNEGNFVSIKTEVKLRLQDLLQELFDKNRPFIQTENLALCEYCPHKSKCGR